MEDKNFIVEENSTKEIENAISHDQNAVPYIPMSKLPPMGTVIPLNLAGETAQAQYKFIEEIPDVDQYLVGKLGYTSKYALSEALGAEQADAVALAVKQIEKGKGFILADMAGIGKGRCGSSILRYAFVNGYLPIFITEKPNLFTAMYRDIVDIGGLKTNPSGKHYYGIPFILNGYKSGGYEITYDESGKKIRKQKPSETGILNKDGVEVITAPKQNEIKEVLKSVKFPKGYDYMMLTYSQLSGSSGKLKAVWIQELINKLDGKVVIVMDECHNASGTKSDVGQSISNIISLAKGVTFVSATFSKRPDNMYIYALKTDIVDSPLGTKKLIEVIKRGGERLTENLASNLVEAQQMIRRERTFENCDVDYEYMSDEDKEVLFSKYNKTIKLYRELEEFFSNRNPLFVRAKLAAIQKFAQKEGIEIVQTKKPKKEKDIEAWYEENDGKFKVTSFTAGDFKRNRFNFIETLLFALKADFVANTTLSQVLNNQLENVTTKDKVVFKSNRKPVIAVRNTLEGVYLDLGLEVGGTIDKADFSIYVLSLAMNAVMGSISLKKIKKENYKKEKESKAEEIKKDLVIENSDFEDNGETYVALLDNIKAIDLDIPLSPIDYVIDKIESTVRPSWDMEYGGGSATIRVGEVTGRKFTLKKQDDGKYKLEINQKPKNKSTTFKQFNNGFYDVLLINESGSTGEDAHSSERFKDQRPRVMVIHQVELDVNTEVQKRGRINRTGQVNYPSYVYAVSRIPSEIRRLLMLSRKLRSLDANTTANQKQSSKLSQIRDSFGNPIEDVINHYGDECLQEFISVPENDSYLQYMPSDEQEDLGKLSDSFAIEVFVRNLELALSDEQEYFYNTINALYTKLKEQKIESGEYDLETNIIDLKAAIKTRVMISKGLNTNPFNTSVYEEDDYALAEEKPYIKEKVEDMVRELAENKDPDEFYQNFLTDYKKHFKEVHLEDVKKSIKEPDYSLAKNEQDRIEMEAEYQLRVDNSVNRAKSEYNAVIGVFYDLRYDALGNLMLDNEGLAITGDLTLKPNRACLVPAVLEECNETDEDGNPIVPSELNNAKFIGVRILKTAKEKYSPMNIELVFCQLSGKPKVIVKPTAKGRNILEWIVVKSKIIDRFRLVQIDNWEVDPNKRNVIRIFTGNILGAYGIARDTVMRSPLEYSPVIQFVKFTTADGASIRFGIKVNMKKYSSLIPNRVPVEYPLNSGDFISDLMKVERDKVYTVNSDENFCLAYNRQKEYLTVHVFGGTNREVKGIRKYFSKLYDDGELFNLIEGFGFSVYQNFVGYTPIGMQRSQTLKSLTFSCYLPNYKTELSQIFDYIYEKQPFNLSIIGLTGDDVIYNKADVFIPEGQDEEEQEKGEFTFDSLKPYESIKEQISSFSKFDRYEKTSPYGTIILKAKPNIREVASYGLIPLEPTIKDMVSNSFSVLNDTKKIKFQELLHKYIEENKSNFEIGSLVQDTLKEGSITDFKNIFGYDADNISYVGEVFRKYMNGEIELPKKEEQQEQKQRELPKRGIDLDTAQEYIIFLKYKINN
jgi:hypothetical protein